MRGFYLNESKQIWLLRLNQKLLLLNLLLSETEKMRRGGTFVWRLEKQYYCEKIAIFEVNHFKKLNHQSESKSTLSLSVN